jgi:uncharacterized repeat protein (TIGR01451 family)
MARGLLITNLLLTLVLSAPSVCQAQHTKSKPTATAGLTSRWLQLKSAWSKDKDSDEPEGKSQSRPKQKSSSSQAKSAPRTSRSRVQPGDMLPKGIFDRTAKPENRGDQWLTEDQLAAMGDSTNNQDLTAPHQSPNATRANELDDALEDILSSDLGTAPLESDGDNSIAPLPEHSPISDDNAAREALVKQSQPQRTANSNRSGSAEAISDLRRQFEALEQTKPSRPAASSTVDTNTPGWLLDHEAERAFTKNRSKPAAAAPSVVADGSPSTGMMLLTSQQPVIVSRVEGPSSIMIGREAVYRVRLENISEAAAKRLSAEVSVPEWADVVDVVSSSGMVERSQTPGNANLKWHLQDLSGRSAQTLTLKLVPRSGKPLQLGVAWSQAPVESQTMVEVQEPKLEMKLSGPSEVMYNQAQRFQLSLRNPGTGPAENVVLKLIPPGGDEQSASQHAVGTLAAGASKEIELELTAKEAGELQMKATATAAGDLQSSAALSVLCKKAELQLDWRGPAEKYAGTEASYYFRLRNTGTADAEAVGLEVRLPGGAKLLTASEGYELDEQSGIVSWTVPTVAAGEAKYLQIRCQVDQAGPNHFELVASARGGELCDKKAIETNVIAVADLNLNISDPQGPVPVGEDIAYEVRIRNRGTTDAQNVGVVGLFSEGIEPTSVEGAQFSVRDGRVSIHPMNTLPAGQELVLRIHAVASKEGTHVFRAEVSCQDLELKLAAEETTRFYEDHYRWEDGEMAYSQEREGVMSR